MKTVFVNDCVADGCYKNNLGKGKQMCKEHQQMYEDGKPFKAFYGKTVLKKEFQSKRQSKALRKANVRRMIKEYAGVEYCFLADYINGGWEDYLLSNMDDIVNKVTTKVVYGVRRIRSEYKSKNRYLIECEIRQTCEDTINYIKRSFA